jgi:hypothetical protein
VGQIRLFGLTRYSNHATYPRQVSRSIPALIALIRLAPPRGASPRAPARGTDLSPHRGIPTAGCATPDGARTAQESGITAPASGNTKPNDAQTRHAGAYITSVRSTT